MSSPDRAATRKVKREVVWQVARANLGRTACEVMDANDPSHNHANCIHDDVSYAADLLLRLVVPAVNGDEDGVLDALTALLDAMDEQ